MGTKVQPRWPSRSAATGRTIRAVARLAKVSGFGTVAKMGAHHARTRPTLNADPARLALNEWLVQPADGDLVAAVKARIAAAEELRREAATAAGEKAPRKRRSDAVLAVEVVLTASPEFFRPERPWEPGTYERERLAAWREASMAWLRERYGDRLVSAVLHLDEATPHIQAVFVPLTEDNRLCAKEVVGGPAELHRFQDSIGAAMAPLGIERGMEGSVALHTDADEYYALVNRPRAQAPVVELDPVPLLGRERWREEQVAKLQAQMEEAVRDADAKATAAELDREKVRNLPGIIADVKADAVMTILDARADADARVEAAERTAEEARQAAAEAERKAQAAQEAAQTAADALKAERKAAADRVRQTPLETVLKAAEWQPDAQDPRYWTGPGSRVRVDGPRSCWDEARGKGAKNAIDLAKLLTGRSYEDAVAWLGEAVGREEAQAAARAAADDLAEDLPEPFQSSVPYEEVWPTVRQDVVQRWRLSERLVDRFKQLGLLIPRPRGFQLAMRDPRGTIVGAELYDRAGFLGLFRRSRRDRGGVRFNRGPRGAPRDVFLVENGRDVLSLAELVRPDSDREQVFASTAGARPRVAWLRELLERGGRLFVAYNANPASEQAAQAIMAQYPTISARWVPKRADWNAQLVAVREAEDQREAQASVPTAQETVQEHDDEDGLDWRDEWRPR
jgi:hypothetical protein